MSPRWAAAPLAAALLLAGGVPPAAWAGESPRAPHEIAQSLMDELASPSLPARIVAAEVLARRGPAARCALPALLDLCLAGDASAETARFAVAAIVPLGGGPWEREVVAVVSSTTNDAGRGARWLAAKVIGATAAELDALVAPWLTGPVPATDRFAAEVAVNVLAELADLVLVERTKDDRSPQVERDDARALLLKLALAPDRALAFRALRVLVRDLEFREEALGRMKQTLADPDADLRGQALLELGLRGRLSPAVVAGLPPMLTSPTPSIRLAAARVLGERGPHAAKHVAAIGALVKDPVPAVRVAAVTSLDRIGLNAPEVPTLLDAFVDDADLAVQAELDRVIRARDGFQGRYRALAERLMRRDLRVARDEVQEMTGSDDRLARIAGIPATEPGRIAAYLLDPDWDVAETARRRLDSLPSFDPTQHLNLLVKVVERCANPSVRWWAARRLVGVGANGVDPLLTSPRAILLAPDLLDVLLYAPPALLERQDVRRLLAPRMLAWLVTEPPEPPKDPRERTLLDEARARFEAVLDRHLDEVRDLARGVGDSRNGAREYLMQRGAPGLTRLAEVLAEEVVDAAPGAGLREFADLEVRFAALQPLLTAADPRLRASACELLEPNRVDDVVQPLSATVAGALEARLEDEDGRVRGAAATVLGEAKHPLSDAALGRCVAMLVDRHPAARGAAADALGGVRARLRAHVSTILAQLDRSPDDEARGRQLWLLGNPMEPPSEAVVAAWVAAVGSPSVEVAAAGLRALERTRPIDAAALAQVLPAVEARLASPAHVEVAARILGLYGPRAGHATGAVDRAAAAGSRAAGIALSAVRGDTATWVALLTHDVRTDRSHASLRDLRSLGPAAATAVPTLREILNPQERRWAPAGDFRADLEATIEAIERAASK